MFQEFRAHPLAAVVQGKYLLLSKCGCNVGHVAGIVKTLGQICTSQSYNSSNKVYSEHLECKHSKSLTHGKIEKF